MEGRLHNGDPMRTPPPEADPVIGRLGVAPPRSGHMHLALPIGLALHLGAVLAAVHEGLRFDAGNLPQFGAVIGQLVAPPAEGLRLGDSSALPTDEGTPEETRRARRKPPDRSALLAMLDRTPPIAPAASFGFEWGVPRGALDGFPDGLPEGVRGGLPGGTPGGAFGFPARGAADPVLPQPDQPPVPIRMPSPRFPEEAVRNGVRGRVVLRALITERGTVEVLRVLRSVPELDQEATRLVESEWRFRPAQRNGRPVPALSDLVVRFTLR